MAKKSKKGDRQVNQYDKVLQENLEAALPGIVKNVLHIHVVQSEQLPDSLQHTKERKPDVLKRVTDDNGKTFILHIEFQVKNDADMVYRIADYLVMLLRKYKLPVKQYVIYIGEGSANMPTLLTNEGSFFSYNLISISSVDYRIFLKSSKTEEKILAILANYGKDSDSVAVENIFENVLQNVSGELERARRKNQLGILGQLRNLAWLNKEFMDSISTIFKEENDLFYISGLQNTKLKVVKNLLKQTDFSVEKIAEITDLSISSVKKIKASFNKEQQ